MKTLYKVNINISGELATFYRRAATAKAAYFYAIREAMNRYGMSRARLLDFHWRVDKVRV